MREEIKITNSGVLVPFDNLSPEETFRIRKDLNICPVSTFGNFGIKTFPVYQKTDKHLVLPLYYFLNTFKNKSYKVCFDNINYFPTSIKSSIILRDSQKECFKKWMEEFEKPFGGGVICLSTGQGKTVLSLKLIEESKKRTLVIVNKIELMNQWKREIKKWFGDSVNIGIIQGTRFDSTNCDIVIGMLQTISLKKTINSENFNWVEACFIDECHNISSEAFSNIMFKVRPKALFGLTATLERKDKTENVIKWYMGDILYDGRAKALKQTTEVHVWKYKGGSSVEKYLRDGTVAVSTMITNISKDLERNNNLTKIIRDLINADERRNILVIGDRIDQLKFFHSKLGSEISGLFIGSMKSTELELSKEKRVLLGTYALVNEGFNLPKLNCLVFATPRSSITQAIGRIYRKEHFINPLIVDIQDDFSIFKGQWWRRRKIYTTSIKDCVIITKSFIAPQKQGVTEKCLFDSGGESEDEIDWKKCLIE